MNWPAPPPPPINPSITSKNSPTTSAPASSISSITPPPTANASSSPTPPTSSSPSVALSQPICATGSPMLNFANATGTAPASTAASPTLSTPSGQKSTPNSPPSRIQRLASTIFTSQAIASAVPSLNSAPNASMTPAHSFPASTLSANPASAMRDSPPTTTPSCAAKHFALSMNKTSSHAFLAPSS